jgi:predicted homoserine dehydrogenase-like protein
MVDKRRGIWDANATVWLSGHIKGESSWQRQSVIRVGIVGFGFMGRMHYGNWKKMKGARVVALCDKNQEQFTAPTAGG